MNRAFGGAALQGTELARFVYLDEAGFDRKEPFLTVAGIIVHGDHQLDKTYDLLEQVLQLVPADQRDGLVLHTADIYGGYGKVFDKGRNPYWTWDRRAEILDALATLPDRANLIICSGSFERADAPHVSEPDAHAATYVSCLIEVETWMRQHAKRENCMIIAEDNHEARGYLREAHRYYQDKKREIEKKYQDFFPFLRIRENPAFQEKQPSHPLIMADFVAFMTKRKRMKDPRVDRFCKPWWKRNAILRVSIPESLANAPD